MAKDQEIAQHAARRRPSLAVATSASGGTARGPVKRRVGPIQFLREVRAEARKVTWTSWKETWITSVMVGIMVLLTAFFFFALDQVLGLGMSGILKLANS